MSYTVVGVQLACQLPLCVERVYSRTLKSFPLFLEFQLIYLTLYHATSLKMLWRLEEVKSTLLFPAPASAARRTALNPGWQSCFGCPCVNVIVEQFFFFFSPSQAFWAHAYVLCINSRVIPRELGTGLGTRGFQSDGFFLRIARVVQGRCLNSVCDLSKCQQT